MTLIDNLLSQNDIFSVLSAVDRKLIIQQSHTHQYRKGQRITRQGDVWPYLILVAEGKVNALKESSEGRSLIVASFEAGELFWGLAFFKDGMPMPVTLESYKSSLLYLWHRDRLQPFILQRGKLSWELCGAMVGLMQRTSEFVEELAFQTVASRLARFLADNNADTQDGCIKRDLTLDEMAAHIGSTREMVCRVLYRFSDRNLIEVTRTEFVIKDQAGLEYLAER